MTRRCLTRDEVRAIDRLATDEFGLPSVALMENAGRGVAEKMRALGIGGRVLIACGKGNNAGDGFVVARHLDLHGVAVEVLLADNPDRFEGDAAVNFRVLEKSGIPIHAAHAGGFGAGHDRPQGGDWLVDALLGTGARGAPQPPVDQAIRWLNDQPGRKMAIDVPSGLDCESGRPAEGCTFRADHTCTFVAPKVGFNHPAARPFLGEVHVVSIGVPRRLLERFGLR